MERAQYLQERSLPELKDFVDKGIFSNEEVKQIVKRRATFETSLVRRVAKKTDFLKYAEYEMNLEALRRKRVSRLGLNSGPPSISDYALVRKQFFIFERAVRKFKSDLGLWVQYIQVARREGARALAGRLCARALQLHPTAPALFILSSSHELEQLSPSAARALLQRGIRLNNESVELWTEYVKMELGYIENLRRRFEVLGITPAAAPGEDESEAVRKEVLGGAVVLAVIENAVKALPTLALFESLQKLLTTFPTPLRDTLLDTLHAHLARVLPSSPEARLLHATRHVTPDLHGAKLVQHLKEANEALVAAVLDDKINSSICDIYADWILQWLNKIDERNLRQYLILSLQSLPSKLASARRTPTLLATSLSLLIHPKNPSAPGSDKALRQARKFTSAAYLPAASAAPVWLARLEVEKRFATPEAVQTSWKEARTQAKGTDEELERVWLWGVSGDSEDHEPAYKELLRASMKHVSPTLHDAILLDYLSHSHLHSASASRKELLQSLLASYRPTGAFYPRAFVREAVRGVDARGTLELIYERWRGADPGEAGLAWAGWLVQSAKDGSASQRVIRSALGAVQGAERDALEMRWLEIVEGDTMGDTMDDSMDVDA